MAERDRPHILLRDPAAAEPYRSHERGFGSRNPPSPGDRVAHARLLTDALTSAATEATDRRTAAGVAVHGAEPGLYVEFESVPGFELKLESLENKKQKIELVAVRDLRVVDPESGDEMPLQRATVFVPEGSVKHFIQRFNEYATQTTKSGQPQNKPMVERVAGLGLATLRALWTDTDDAFPAPDETLWWEVWLRKHDGHEVGRLHEFAGHLALQVSPRRLEFHDRIVTLVRATAESLSASLDVLNDLAEVRRAKQTASVFGKMRNTEQREWVDELVARTRPPGPGAPAVCILDTGINRAHPLLTQALAPDDLHACDPAWGTHDHHGHGTEMAGLALYGDLASLLASSHPISLRHSLESVKILPPVGQNPPELWGNLTADAASRVEIQAPTRRRTFSMSIASEDTRDQGRPTSWSAAIDALAAGRSFDASTQGLVYLDGGAPEAHRLFVVCAGNVDTTEVDHLTRSDLEPVHDPGQAWNALTVGAFTERTDIDSDDASLAGHEPLAAIGELSPYSSTSVSFAEEWPVKPEVVAEGGNKAVPPGSSAALQVDCLSLLTTYHDLPTRLLGTTWATSAATAQVSRIASIVSAEYPDFWPETIRGLVVSSARWTNRMRARLGQDDRKRARLNLVRRYGFGVPSLDRALHSARNALTLIAQDEIHPFAKGKMREMHIHRLPWPRDALAALGEQAVELRVTLSYFIEPNPGERGWKRRHRYTSHGLRFALKSATESEADFRKRLNQQALDEDEERPETESDSSAWFLGSRARNKGSLHSDIWVGTAADLAERGCIGIYPVSGWWKDQPARDRSEHGARYSLVVSIETQQIDLDVDIWTPVAQAVGVEITT